MQIRHARREDAEGIAAINAEAWRSAFRGVVSDAYLDDFDGKPDMRREHLVNLPSDALQLVAVEDDKLIGWLAAGPASEDDCDSRSTFEVAACYVRPDRWRCGVGRKLMLHLVGDLDVERWNKLIVWTARDTAASHRFYESLGFGKDGNESTIDRNGPVPIVRFQLDLPVRTP